MKPYTPSKKILENYADVMVNYAINNGKGIRKGDVVYLVGYESAKPLYAAIAKKITQSGGHVIGSYRIDDPAYPTTRDFYENANKAQIEFFPEAHLKGLIKQIDHSIFIISETDKQALKSVNPKKIMQRGLAMKPFMDMRNKKQAAGKFSWTLCLYGTKAMADEVKMSEKEYWDQIIKACYLRDKNPVATWKQLQKDIQTNVKKLDKLEIDTLHLTGNDLDLEVKLSPKSAWKGGSGANIPSFEIFTSPDWRGTNGWIRFDQPLYRYGNLVEGIYLEFKNGVVTKATAKKGQKVLHEMIATKNANKVGEFSLTDKRFSKITKFMGETLYDENRGGKYGNTHIALGMAYRDCYKGDHSKVTEKQWEKLGYNNSSVHTDIVSTSNRTVTAILKNGKKKVIYTNGQFTL